MITFFLKMDRMNALSAYRLRITRPETTENTLNLLNILSQSVCFVLDSVDPALNQVTD